MKPLYKFKSVKFKKLRYVKLIWTGINKKGCANDKTVKVFSLHLHTFDQQVSPAGSVSICVFSWAFFYSPSLSYKLQTLCSLFYLFFITIICEYIKNTNRRVYLKYIITNYLTGSHFLIILIDNQTILTNTRMFLPHDKHASRLL